MSENGLSSELRGTRVGARDPFSWGRGKVCVGGTADMACRVRIPNRPSEKNVFSLCRLVCVGVRKPAVGAS